jgi:hypothetical protein
VIQPIVPIVTQFCLLQAAKPQRNACTYIP